MSMLTRSKKTQWFAQLEKLKTYVAVYDKLPPSDDSLLIWYNQQCKNYSKHRHAMTDDDLRSAWENFTSDRWQANLDELIAFHEEYKRMPNRKSRLGRWRSNQEKNYAEGTFVMKNPDIKHAWEVFVATIAPDEATFDINLGLLHRYVETNGVKPGRNTPLGGWMYEQIQRYADNRMSNDQAKKWEAMRTKCNMQFMTRRTQWYMNLQKVIDHLVSNDGEVKLQEGDWYHRWVNTQIHNFDNRLDEMADEGIRELWVHDFLERVDITP